MAKNVLTIRVSDEKRASWKACADKSGVSLSAWIEAMCDGVGGGGDFAPDWKPTQAPKKREPVKAPVKAAPVAQYVRRHSQTCNCSVCRPQKETK